MAKSRKRRTSKELLESILKLLDSGQGLTPAQIAAEIDSNRASVERVLQMIVISQESPKIEQIPGRKDPIYRKAA